MTWACDAASPLEIVYADASLVAINKPAGMLVHRSPIDPRETRFAMQRLRDQLNHRVYPVHRLDRATSGLLLFALSPAAASEVSRAFASGAVRKRYLAVVRGHTPETLAIDHPLREEVDARGARIHDGVSREAFTELRCERHWTLPEPVDRYPEARYSLVTLSPRTGRYRQLRRHMKHVSHPIIGDTRYGKGTHNRFFRARLDCHRLLLAATQLSLPHPETGAVLEIHCDPDETFQRVVDDLGARSCYQPPDR